MKQWDLERKEDLKSLKRRGPQITSAVSWDPELWEAVDCEDPYVKMWAEKYHKLLVKNVPSCHPDMLVAAKALNGALKDYKYRIKEDLRRDQKKLDENKVTKELRDLYLVQQGEEAARAPEATTLCPTERTARGYLCKALSPYPHQWHP